MNKYTESIHKYCSNHTTPQSELLYQLERETNLKTLAPQMISGHLQGHFLSLLSKLQSPKRILEIGSFTGYATICLAQGLREDGILHTIEGNPEMAYFVNKYVEKAGLKDKVVLHIGDAKQIVKDLDEMFDIVFIDAGKRDYALYFDLIIEKVNSGGILLADNVLWSGKVISDATDIDTRTLDAFNKKIQDDPRVENMIMPLRDGLTIIRKL